MYEIIDVETTQNVDTKSGVVLEIVFTNTDMHDYNLPNSLVGENVVEDPLVEVE